MTSFVQTTNSYSTLFFANNTDTWTIKAGVSSCRFQCKRRLEQH